MPYYTVFNLGIGIMGLPSGSHLGPVGTDKARGLLEDQFLKPDSVMWRLEKEGRVLIVPGEVATLEEAKAIKAGKPAAVASPPPAPVSPPAVEPPPAPPENPVVLAPAQDGPMIPPGSLIREELAAQEKSEPVLEQPLAPVVELQIPADETEPEVESEPEPQPAPAPAAKVDDELENIMSGLQVEDPPPAAAARSTPKGAKASKRGRK